MNVAIIGAGNGGCAAAADLTRRGFAVRLYSRSPATIDPIRERGGLDYVGVMGEGFAPIPVVTNDPATAVRGADAVMLVAPLLAHAAMVSAIAPHLQPGQLVLATPGHTAVTIARALTAHGFADPVVCGSSTLPYAARLIAPATVRVSLEVRRLYVAAFPGDRTAEWFPRVATLYPAATPAGDVMETMFRYMNAIHHPAATLCNVGRIEWTGGDFLHYFEGITPSVGRLIDRIDGERVAVAASLGIPTQSFVEYFREIGYTTPEAADTGSAYEVFHQSAPNRHIRAPTSVDHRYFEEDVPFGLVPFAELGRLAGVPTPTMDAIIELVSTIKDVDYRSEGLTLDRMGFADMTADRVIATVRHGFDAAP
ncbi:MAG TPA: NAD/NADP octopine/nopaline dehydrogenase family protein [Candidatus Limnocylindria bacterium]|nr:NAD/NADP octopine/nopaline dehydrogenase family protein [Candidatus Limnocylindria bacterium]